MRRESRWSDTLGRLGKSGRSACPAPGPSSYEELERIYRSLFSPLVNRVTWRFRRLSREDACDIVQDAFAIALIKLDICKNPEGWLTQVVDFLAVNACRKSKRRAALLSRWHPNPVRIIPIVPEDPSGG
jgi:DNA-directed RNA polymerase specialized sigma24 family protein